MAAWLDGDTLTVTGACMDWHRAEELAAHPVLNVTQEVAELGQSQQ